jgi:outer membrane lipoprotein-sorting protein
MRRIFVITNFMILLAVTSASAQSPEVIKAKQILDKVSNITQSYNSIKADFTFSLENTQADMTDTHEGTILISGDKYKATVMNVDSYYNGETLWTYLKEVGEVNISNPDPEDETTLSPANIFNIHEKGFRYIFAGEDTLKNKKVNVVDLFPENRDKPYSRIKLYINQNNDQISKIVQLGKDGNNYIINIKEMKTNVPVDPSMFMFNAEAHPDVDIIDMR